MKGDEAAVFFLAFAVVLGLARLFSAAARRVGQPSVVGEIVAGILLGSTLLSDTWGPWGETVALDGVRPLLGALANVGLAMFMFVIGYEMDHSAFLGSGRTTLSVAAGSTLVPLAGGCLVALPFAAEHGPSGSAGFVLFTGVALSVTAFPVLARILADRRMNRTAVGRFTMAAAAVNDLAAWVLLAGVVACFGSADQWRVTLLPLYLLVLVSVVRPLMARLLRPRETEEGRPTSAIVVVTTGLMASCAATEWLGVHFVFGAFAFGAVMPRAGLDRLRVEVMERMEMAGTQVLLPVYFVVAGTGVNLAAFDGSSMGLLVAALVVAVSTKMSGAYLGARTSGLQRDDALTVSILMNTRGLAEVVILTVGLRMGLIDEEFYSVLIVVAVLTTAMTGPLLRLMRREGGTATTHGPETGAVLTPAPPA
ncbi:Na/H antiporter [Streptomyces viridochromogenes DSM 40736]|uniref:Na/H antiporter n=1 Tax=Streptomyces viridochromogenes (strain DSM 40736 / JCM 4977 / BCRC 1201 / Tue 494) TaxID=591159 RepID=D9XF07_STRVT|nr:cation:proton antiporter [Streptomyces viridochromogenes]EFL30486.1 Na/H antiporter [Streptomyces viridochromogenes DSM 40736]